MAIAINPVFPVIGAQSVAPEVALQPGTVIDATVLKVLENNFVRVAIANLSIDVLSEVPLQAGQTLQLAVSQTAQGVKLAIVPDDGGADNSLPAVAGAGAGGVSSSVVSDDSPATNVAPNIAAPKIAPLLDASTATNAARPLTNLEALAVSAAVQTAAAKQGSLAPLFANLSVAASSANLPPVLQQAASALLTLRPDLNGNISGEDIKAAFEKSGLFFEQSQSVRASAAPAAIPSSPANEQPDLKAALIVFRQTVASWLDTAQSTPSATAATAQQAAVPENAVEVRTPQQAVSPSIVPHAQDIETEEIMLPQAARPVAEEVIQTNGKVSIYSPSESLPTSARVAASNAGLTSLQEILQAFPKGVQDAVHVLLDNEANALPLNTSAHQASTTGTNPSDTPPPFRGAAPSAQPVAAPSLGPDAEPVAVAKHLVSDADAAIARQTLLQVASLPDRVDMQGMRQDVNAPRWNFEIPFATTQGTAVAQFEISRDGSNGSAVEAGKRVWKARFSLNVEPSGPVHALVSLTGERASVRMWAERPSTVSQLRANAPQLTHALREAALEPGDIVIADGSPPQPPKPPAGHFLDRAL